MSRENREESQEELRRLALRRGRLDDDEPEEEEEEEQGTARESVVQLELLRKQRCIIISEPITPKLTQRVVTQLLWLDMQAKAPIRLFINTPGGSADDGFALHDVIRFVRSTVLCICVGLNASAGTLVLLGTPKDRRFALPNARIMIHQPSGGARGRASDIEITADEILKLRRRANEIIAAETGKTVEQVERDTDRDYWLTAEEAKKYGLVSKVIKSVDEVP